jgi:hypothetical protein
MEGCSRCHSCSLACARLVHQRLSWDMAGIRIASSGGLSTAFEARTCLGFAPRRPVQPHWFTGEFFEYPVELGPGIGWGYAGLMNVE